MRVTAKSPALGNEPPMVMSRPARSACPLSSPRRNDVELNTLTSMPSLDDHTTLAPFADYYQGRPNNAGLLLRVVPDETMRGLELRKGSVDLVITDLSPDIVDGLKQEPHLRVTTAEGTDFAYLGFNLRDSLLQDKRVRLAVGYAIDQQAIVRYLRRGLATPAIGIVPPMSWAHDPTVFRFERDVERAKALLDAAGYPDPDGDGYGVDGQAMNQCLDDPAAPGVGFALAAGDWA